MRFPSGVTDQYLYFVAVDSTDFTTRETGLSSFTVYRSRNGAAAAAMTTPTVNETDVTNMPGVYELLLDEDMTVAAGNDSEAMAFHITKAGMAPVTLQIELYREKITAGNTLDVTATGAAGVDWGNIENPTTTVGLSGTNIKTDQVVASVSGAVGSVTGHTPQTGDSFAIVNGAAGLVAINADVEAILGDTNELQVDWVNGGRLDLILDAASAPTAAAVADAVWDEVRSGHATAGTYGQSFNAIVSGAAEAGTLSTTQMTSDLAEATDSHYNGRAIIWTSGALANQAATITAYLGSTGMLTYAAVTEAPSAADTFIIV